MDLLGAGVDAIEDENLVIIYDDGQSGVCLAVGPIREALGIEQVLVLGHLAHALSIGSNEGLQGGAAKGVQLGVGLAQADGPKIEGRGPASSIGPVWEGNRV